jgi:polyferredoxin
VTQTTSQPPSLYAAREPIFPRRVSGKFRTLKWWILAVTLGIYYILPWLRWDRGPNLPDQAVLIDLASRRFYFFFIEIWPQEFYFVAGLLIMAGLGLFLFTAALGRVWCGYTCPQTVWTDLFMLVERWIEGDRNARVRLWNAPWTAQKIRLYSLKWTLWLLIALATGGAWVFYFADAPTLVHQLVTHQAPLAVYVWIGILTFTTYALAGFMREQVCLYMCPWPRIQSAMIDEQTLTVAYRDWRGEPRGKGNVRRRSEAQARGAAAQAAGPGHAVHSPERYPHLPSGVADGPETRGTGDCIDCFACVNVCPTGVDIREGQQMGCITCALCIDACDDVMDRIGKPRGLIDYVTLADGERERLGGQVVPIWRRILRPRILLYFVLWAGIGAALVAALAMRSDLAFSIEKVRNPVNVVLSDGSVRNAYEIRLRNKSGYDRDFRLSVAADAPVEMELQGLDGLVVTVPADQTFRQRAYVASPRDGALSRAGLTPIEIVVEDAGSGRRAVEDTVFAGRGQ